MWRKNLDSVSKYSQDLLVLLIVKLALNVVVHDMFNAKVVGKDPLSRARRSFLIIERGTIGSLLLLTRRRR